jgi:hypothetical protein
MEPLHAGHFENDKDNMTDPAIGRLRGRSTAGCLAMLAVQATAVCGPEFDVLGAASRCRC